MKKRRVLKIACAVVLLSTSFALTGAGADGLYIGCYVCADLLVPSPSGGAPLRRVICWDFDTGVGYKYCYEWGNYCIKHDACQSVLPPGSA